MSLLYNKELIPRAKELRKDMTLQEKKLWYRFLSKYPVRFQRQKTIDCFIVDFFCAKAKLAVEIDGSQHFTDDGMAYDDKRSRLLSKCGVNVIRFSNTEINRSFQEVCWQIDNEVKRRTPPVTS